MVKQVEILIIESSAIIRAGLIYLIEEGDITNIKISEISDVGVVLSGSYRSVPDIIIINSSTLGVTAPAQLRGSISNEELKIIALQSSFTEQSHTQNYDDVISLYDSTESIKSKLLLQIQNDEEQDAKKELSQREKEIIVCVVKGMTNKVIAETLYISTHTVIAHRRNIATKLQIHSPAGLTIYAIVNKLVDLSDIKNSISKGEAE